MTSKSNRKDFIISDIWDKWILLKKNNNITIGRITKGNTNMVNILIKYQLCIRINNDTFFMFIKNTSQQLRKLNSSKRKEYLTRPLRCKFVLMKGRKLKSKKRDSNGRQIVIGYDGRWSSRRSGRECTVSLIIIDGIKELKNKVIFSASMKTSEDENSQFVPFYFEKKIHSSLMEGYLLHQSFCFLKKFGLNLVGIVHDLDLKSFGIIKNIYGEEIKEYFDINHFF
ncbi:hypothetical protein M0812_17545 [Anaeramoeba flamelloides]|uniref:Uncharacterized protein n=1 Tax=Anaeramoeba flamelloides TaxID=1746091 RepID=A0AAV7ZCT6_9EUKA|nr:hypothetical protein M0812_17545 [Anaeramoeba flamelloides]